MTIKQIYSMTEKRIKELQKVLTGNRKKDFFVLKTIKTNKYLNNLAKERLDGRSKIARLK